MHLKDYFAAHFAAALADRIERPDAIAARAYELAEAMLRERGFREREQDQAFLDHAYREQDEPEETVYFESPGLLDEPAPLSESEGFEVDPAWLDRDIDPRWELEPRWQPAAIVERPGLARTTPVIAEPEKTRKPA